MLNNKGFIVKKTNCSSSHTEKIRKELLVSPSVNQNFSQTDSFHVYRESPNHFRLPRFFGSKLLPNFASNFVEPIQIDIEFKGTLKDSLHQNEAVNKSVSTLKSIGGGILSLPTGFGKTTCALAILSRINHKTIIIVHKEFLMNQWIERINQFLPEASIGIIRQNKLEINKDITIAMLQTLCSKSFPKNTFDSFGLTIIDESHHICSKVFSHALFNVSTKYILGLSATPERKDGLTYVLKWFIGDIILSIERKQQKQVEVHQINFNCDTFNKNVPLNNIGKINLPELINIIVDIDERNSLIFNLLQLSMTQNRKVIVLTERRSHCLFLHQHFPDSSINTGLYMGGMKQQELKQNESCDILFATFSLAHEGLDIPTLDTLILATSKSDVVQSCGRILRETGTKTNFPLIYDIVDNWGPLPNQFRKRKTFYKKSGFEILSSIETKESKESTTKLNDFSFIDE